VSDRTFLQQFASQYVWQSAPAKRRFRFRKQVNHGLRETHRLALTLKGVVDRSIDDDEGLQSSDYSTYQIFEQDNLVFKLIDLENIKTSRVGYVPRRGIMSPAYIRLEKTSLTAWPRYYYWFFYAAYLNNIFNGMGGGVRQNLTPTDLLEFPIPLPDLETQKAIADFLDRETARIDQLIEKKQQLAVLLVEREKNLIGECLTRGIDPKAEFKVASQEWLGSIPSHWDVVPLKSLIWYQEGPGILADDFREEGVPLLRIKGLSGQHASLEGCNYLDPEKVQRRWEHFRVELGDFLISASATRGGIASLVTDEVLGAVPYTGIIRIKPRDKGYVSEIIPYFLLSSLFDTQIDLLSAGSTIQHFGPTHLGRMKAPLAPQEEQRKIAKFLDDRVPLIRGTREQTEDSQSKLKEFRAALITAAVTGQIDVAAWEKRGRTEKILDEIEARSSGKEMRA
jgi:type I restriction enzyme S subunit